MVSRSSVLQALESVPVVAGVVGKEEFTLSAGTANSDSVIAEHQAARPIAVRTGVPVQVVIPAYEEFTTNGTGGDTETFNFAHSIVDSSAIADSLVLYEGGNRVQPDSINFSGDSFDYTDDGTNNTLHAYYVSNEQATLEIEKEAPNGNTKRLHSQNLGLTHTRELAKQPVTISNSEVDEVGEALFPIVPTDYDLQISIDAPYPTQFQDDTDTNATADNAMVSVPVNRSRQTIPGLQSLVGQTFG